MNGSCSLGTEEVLRWKNLRVFQKSHIPLLYATMDPQNGGDGSVEDGGMKPTQTNALLFEKIPQKYLNLPYLCCLFDPQKMGNLLRIPIFLPKLLFRSTKKDSWKNNLLTSWIHSSLISISHSQTSQKYVGSQKPGP